MSSKTMLRVGGALNVALALFHVFFWQIFGWSEQLAVLDEVNRAIMQLLNIAVISAVTLFAYLALFHADQLTSTRLGHAVLGGIVLFFVVRGIAGVVLEGPSAAGQAIVIGILALLIALHGIPLMRARRQLTPVEAKL